MDALTRGPVTRRTLRSGGWSSRGGHCCRPIVRKAADFYHVGARQGRRAMGSLLALRRGADGFLMSTDWRLIEDEREKYKAYLKSPEWAEKRQAVKERSGDRCERCRILTMDDTHHLTYERKYNEPLEDLQAVCTFCHQFIHGIITFDPLDPNGALERDELTEDEQLLHLKQIMRWKLAEISMALGRYWNEGLGGDAESYISSERGSWLRYCLWKLDRDDLAHFMDEAQTKFDCELGNDERAWRYLKWKSREHLKEKEAARGQD